MSIVPSRPDWSDRRVIIVASGKSALRANVRDVRERVPDAIWVAVNLSIALIPWADVMYAGDSQFWSHYGPHVRYPARKFCAQGTPYPQHIETLRVTDSAEWSTIWPYVGNLGNSGAHALNIALLAGARDIALVGFDMAGMHWHPDHTSLINANDRMLSKWAARFRTFDGVNITNCSPVSRIKCYPVMTLTDWANEPR